MKLGHSFCKSKTQTTKVMFLSAVVRLRPGFDGKLGIWRVAKNYTAMRDSKSHKRGDVYEKDCAMTSEHYFKMMQEQQVFRSFLLSRTD